MRVIFLNEYPMDLIWQEWLKQESPGHHLWGMTNFYKYGISCQILKHEKYTRLKKISQKIKVLGDLDQQLRILLQQSQFDVVYTGHYFNTLLLGFLHNIGLFKKPIYAIAYQSFRKSIWSMILVKFMVSGHDQLLCMSSEIKKQFQDAFNLPEDKLELIEWGCDLDFFDIKTSNYDPKTESNNQVFILSAGKSYRDYQTLTTVFKTLDCNLKIYCTKESAPQDRALPDNIRVFYNPQQPAFLSYEEMFAEYKRAYAVAIPLDINPRTSHNMIGLTNLLEAMTLGKAVIMTRNQQLNIDIEKEGIGLWVKPGDVAGWRKGISYLLEYPNETQEMGKRARLLCEQKYNLDLFSQEIARIMSKPYTKNLPQIKKIGVQEPKKHPEAKSSSQPSFFQSPINH